ncbi:MULTISPECIES: ATP-dependent RecD-like DNA helicase [Myroides]|uniref:AAA family ATPase n=1 Tax=Myroides albus TaxID=2562892 RepID=A0A6I3LR00_9FLAO|nr:MULTISPECIES: AAA family ATPase [Myroides]MTG98602.1 AAA family ATPase [Myroides albus]MVX35872.1 AAA family ATPase [Myroides sp. LoEW2-1]UVD79972.1 AAA family ATPase [Myroides albus]
MIGQQFYRLLRDRFPYELTLKQDVFLQKIAEFVTNDKDDQLFVLKGYAGTGKTTLLSSVVNELKMINKFAVMLAPTGRAAKVISNYSQRPAFTIHKHIYYPKPSNSGGGMRYTMRNNRHKNTIFIVDEASMIGDMSASDSNMYPHGSLLDDLIYYVYSGINCKLILIGDSAQLPPVNMQVSPALDIDQLGFQFNMDVQYIELDEVMRQEEDSGILYNATELRSLLDTAFFDTFQFDVKGFKDIVRLVDGYDIQDAIYSSYSNSGPEETAFIVRSNKRANAYNQQIRARILDKESEISSGDLLMVVKNNYYWLKDSTITDFIANGDIIEVLEIYKTIELYGFRFANVRVRMIDYPDMKSFDTIVLLDTLTSESPALTYEQQNYFYQQVMLDYQDEISKYKMVQKVKENEYFNALQVKFSYAITCHKSQGGQWETVFIEQPYLPDGISPEYIRWLYTAMTRAKDKLYLIGFKDEFFIGE